MGFVNQTTTTTKRRHNLSQPLENRTLRPEWNKVQINPNFVSIYPKAIIIHRFYVSTEFGSFSVFSLERLDFYITTPINNYLGFGIFDQLLQGFNKGGVFTSKQLYWRWILDDSEAGSISELGFLYNFYSILSFLGANFDFRVFNCRDFLGWKGFSWVMLYCFFSCWYNHLSQL